MVIQIELIGDDAADNGGSPDAGFQSISDRAAVENILQLFSLPIVESTWPARALAFQQSLLAVLVPLFNPQGDGGTMHLEKLGDLTGRPAFDA